MGNALKIRFLITLILGVVLIHGVPSFGAEVKQSEILAHSELSYKADGGFTGIRSYSVRICCNKGKITTVRTILDPRINSKPILGSFEIRPISFLLVKWARCCSLRFVLSSVG